AILHSGNKPYLMDANPTTGNINPDEIQRLPLPLSAIIPAHLYGLPAPMAALCAWAKINSVFVIEDGAQTIGVPIDGQPVGSWGEVSIFSFGQGKIVDTELGGALLTDDSRLAQEIETILAKVPVWSNTHANLTDQWNQIYWALHQFETDNPRLLSLYPPLFDIYRELIAYRLPTAFWHDLPNALVELPENLRQRQPAARCYDELTADLPVTTLPRPPDSGLWRYPLLVPAEHRDNLLRQLWSQGFHEITRWYPSLRPMLSALAPDLPAPATPGADKIGAEIINLPVQISAETASQYTAAIRAYFTEI
ncbi:MAG TPA: DegT/DnrJ/EryC1/StrS family aminotransferase, partial [Phototrophicaceae bacterium]|nr:DegT/DnrJ/EryC1/StrS family aminotransferase [Phototrophicaceae bacterium]